MNTTACNSAKWEVIIWTSETQAFRFEFDTKDAAYLWANDRPNVYAVEIYGPNGEHDAA